MASASLSGPKKRKDHEKIACVDIYVSLSLSLSRSLSLYICMYVCICIYICMYVNAVSGGTISVWAAPPY